QRVLIQSIHCLQQTLGLLLQISQSCLLRIKGAQVRLALFARKSVHRSSAEKSGNRAVEGGALGDNVQRRTGAPAGTLVLLLCGNGFEVVHETMARAL